ncbi:hypothetical protein [Spiroplasma endosymbiont of Panorpa germanica]|uniref:hypothetical protein n=1 Tax=Spiroplasma endosymbiont of Panorpa germanica TaxID=3066314 RepID=UPI0030D0AC06
MNNELIHNIRERKYITTKDEIVFRTIQDVVSAIFSDENKVSYLTGINKISDNEQVWFPNFVTDAKKSAQISEGYAIYPSPNKEFIYKVEVHKSRESKIKAAEKVKPLDLIVFGKFFEKEKGIGYHFLGIFKFQEFEDDNLDVMVYKKKSDRLDLRK